MIQITVNERIKDLRNSKKLKVKELAKELNMPGSTYNDYEQDDKSIPHEVIIKLCKYYGVSADYILGLSNIHKKENIDFSSLHLSDSAIEKLQDPNFDSRLISEIIESGNVDFLLKDLNIYINGYLQEGIEQFNVFMDFFRYKMEITKKINEGEKSVKIAKDIEIESISLAQEEYYMHIFAKDMIKVANEIKDKYKNSPRTADGGLTLGELIEIAAVYKDIENNKRNPIKFLSGLRKVIKILLKNRNMINTSSQKLTYALVDAGAEGILNSPILETDTKKRRDNIKKYKNQKKKREKNDIL